MNPDEIDEFGDCSFLMDVDLDAIAAGLENNNKRRKISVSPSRNISTDQADLEKTLSKYFGYSKFREGQISVLQNVLASKDTVVLWATGKGKSLCFQLPALHTEKITVVVSPLISLMKDQVHKLNGSMVGHDLATFLGSGQTDRSVERDALQGKFRLVYITPEKLLSAGFLDQLASLHKTKVIGLLAIDEAHCVSEWGHDFRKEYRGLGAGLRNHKDLFDIPIIALTATAVPRVQEDLCKSLHLQNPMVSRQSFDRTNLVIAVHKKERGSAIPSAMGSLLKTLFESSSPQQQSTIIYAPTRSQVEDISSYLNRRLKQEGKTQIQVEGYHAGMTMEARNLAHTNFLTGKTTVICATVAFAMGIDKPDTRRVIHFGPPKTVEEYYQQIGRAGRDGIKAHCTMWIAEADFDKYKSDFYLGGLHGPAKEAVVGSIDALRKYALDSSNCRRKALLDFFQEIPSFGSRCGTCDTCRKLATYDDSDLERDFGPIARVILQAADALNEQGAGIVVDVISGKSVDSYRYKRGTVESNVKESVLSRKNEMKKKVSQDRYRELMVPLVLRGFMKEATKTMNINGHSRSWTTYAVTPQGTKALYDRSVPITLPVPESLLVEERKEKARREKVLSQLKESGVAIDKLPQEEIEAGDGDVIRAYSKWQAYLESMRRNGREHRVAELEELLVEVEKWRAETAIHQRMAPGSVLAEQILLTLSYTAATLPSGLTLGEDDLVAAGVRTRGIGSLCKVLAQWADKHQASGGAANSSSNDDKSSLMRLTPGTIVKGGPWKYAVYKPAKKTGLATWEASYNRFVAGESPQTISLNPANGRPIQVRTVCNHITQAIAQGRGVDLHRLASFLPPPTSSEWEHLQAAEISLGLDVCEDDKIKKSDFLRPIMGDKFIDTPYGERDEDEKAKFGAWCDRLEWYFVLRRIGYKPGFA